jgi:hypothetical protein
MAGVKAIRAILSYQPAMPLSYPFVLADRFVAFRESTRRLRPRASVRHNAAVFRRGACTGCRGQSGDGHRRLAQPS